MEHILEFEEYLNEKRNDDYMSQREYEKFLINLPQDFSIETPTPIMGGKSFNKSTNTNTTPKEALKAVKTYGKTKSDGDLRAKVSFVFAAGDNHMERLSTEKSVKSGPFSVDYKKLLNLIDDFKKIRISYSYSDFNEDSYRSQIKKSSLD